MIELEDTIFQHVVIHGNNGILEQLLRSSLELKPGKIKNYNLILDNIQMSLLEFIIVRDENGMIETILRFVKDNEKYLGDGCITDCVKVKFNRIDPKGETIKYFMNSIRDNFGINYVLQFLPSKKKSLDDFNITPIECLQDDTEALINFLLEYDRYGRTNLLKGVELNSLQFFASKMIRTLSKI